MCPYISAHCEGKLIHGGVTQLPNLIDSVEVFIIQFHHIHIKVIRHIISWAVHRRNNSRHKHVQVGLFFPVMCKMQICYNIHSIMLSKQCGYFRLGKLHHSPIDSTTF